MFPIRETRESPFIVRVDEKRSTAIAVAQHTLKRQSLGAAVEAVFQPLSVRANDSVVSTPQLAPVWRVLVLANFAVAGGTLPDYLRDLSSFIRLSV